MRYAVAYNRYPDDEGVFFNGNAICMFQQDEGTVEMLKQYYLVYIPITEKNHDNIYEELEKAISKEVGEPCELVFTHARPTIWRKKEATPAKK